MGSEEFTPDGQLKSKPFYGVEEDLENENISIEELIKRLSSSSSLEQHGDLFLRKIPFDNVAQVEKLGDFLGSPKANKLKRIVFNKNGAEKDDPNVLEASKLAILLERGFLKQTQPTLEVIGVTSNNMTLETCMVLSYLLFQKGSVVKKLYLYNNNIDSACLKVIFSPILLPTASNTSPDKVTIPPLTKLVILANNVGDEGAKYVVKIAEAIPTLNDIVLKKTGLKEEGVLALANFIESHPDRLTHIDISENTQFGLKAFTAFCAAVEKSTALNLLDMNEIGMDSLNAVEVLVKLIRNNKSLRKIDISDNRIADNGVKAIATVLSEQDVHLGKIDISNVGLTGEGIRYVIDAVKKNSNLKKVYIYRVEFFFEDSGIEKDLKELKKIIKSDFIDEEVITSNEINTDPNDEENVEEPSEEDITEEDDEDDNITDEELSAHPLFASLMESATPKKDEL